MDKIIPIDDEYIYEGRVTISQTDLNGVITFVNRKFCEISGYSVEDLIGSDYTIVRHPDVPDSIFDKMWETIKSGRVWNGLLKNMRIDGKFYWVDMEVAPVLNNDEEITGYISVGKPAPRKNIIENDKLYKNTNETKTKG